MDSAFCIKNGGHFTCCKSGFESVKSTTMIQETGSKSREWEGHLTNGEARSLWSHLKVKSDGNPIRKATKTERNLPPEPLCQILTEICKPTSVNKRINPQGYVAVTGKRKWSCELSRHFGYPVPPCPHLFTLAQAQTLVLIAKAAAIQKN